MRLRSLVLSILLIFSITIIVSAAEVSDGYVRLILHERTGRFSLFFLSDAETMRYEPLFNSREPRASYIAVNVNGRVFRLGDSSVFNTRIERQAGNPAFVFESPFLTVNEVFSPVKTPNSRVANGVMITISIRNTSEEQAAVGMRFLLDTELGEKRGRDHFVFYDNRLVSGERLFEGRGGDVFWISRGENVALMGSIVSPINPGDTAPSFVHIANWKRMHDARWNLRYLQGRSFNNFPYSINDSAVCYYYEPAFLAPGASVVYTIFLTTEDAGWYETTRQAVAASLAQTREEAETLPPVPEQPVTEQPVTEAPVPEPEPPQAQPAVRVVTSIDIAAIEAEAGREAAQSNESFERIFLIKLQEILDQFISGSIHLNEHDLAEIEKSINRLRNRN